MSHFVLTAGLAAGAILAVAFLRVALRTALVLTALSNELATGRRQDAVEAVLAEIIPFPVARVRATPGHGPSQGPRAAA